MKKIDIEITVNYLTNDNDEENVENEEVYRIICEILKLLEKEKLSKVQQIKIE